MLNHTFLLNSLTRPRQPWTNILLATMLVIFQAWAVTILGLEKN